MVRERVLTLRISAEEYNQLSALSMLEDSPISAIVRQAIQTHANHVVTSRDYPKKVASAKARADRAERELRESLGIEQRPTELHVVQ